jgi:hypothetical protein
MFLATPHRHDGEVLFFCKMGDIGRWLASKADVWPAIRCLFTSFLGRTRH